MPQRLRLPSPSAGSRPIAAMALGLALAFLGPPSWCDIAADSANGRNLFNQGKYAEAAAVLEKVAAKGAADVVDLAVLGLCYINVGRLADADRVLGSARAAGPSNSLVYIALGTLAFTRKDYELAYGHFERASRLDPGSPQAKGGMVASLVNRGVILFEAGKAAEARKAFQSALTVDPRSLQAIRNLGIVELKEGNASRAAELFEQAVALSADDPQLLEMLIAALGPLQDPARLLKAYAQLAKAQPANAEAFANLGMLLEQQNRQAEAEQAFARAERLGTEEPYPYLHLARLSIAKGDRTDAGRLLRQAVGKAIQKAGRIQASAARQVEQGKGAPAPAQLRELEGLSRLAEEPRQILQQSLELLRTVDGEASAFEADLLELSSWYPQSVELKVAIGELYQEQGRWKEAVELWVRLLEKHPATPEAQLGLALSLERSGSLPESAIAYLRALDLSPRDPAVYDGLERVSRALHREEELLAKLLDRSHLDALNPLLLRRMGLLERELGRAEDSRVHLERAEKLERPEG